VDFLEQRMLLSASPAQSAAAKTIATPPVVVVGRVSTIRPDATSNATLAAPFSPSTIRTAYGVSSISFNGATGDGTGQTIAIVDAFNDPDIIPDANSFSSEFGLPQFNGSGEPTLQVLNENGGTSLTNVPNATAGNWDVEESLDVEWAHSIAPNANVILYEANSAEFSDLLTAVQTAATHPLVSAVSMSWGGSEFSGENSYDSDFTQPGVTFIASAGDSGAPAGYPAYSPDVVAVGGTSLTLNSNSTYDSESGWSESGGGVSTQESIPSYQVGKINGVSTTNRAAPDVSMDADPNTGVYVLDSYDEPGYYLQVGGTSLAAPMWAGLIAIANQGRVLSGLSPLSGATQTLPALYNLPSSDFYDVTTGNNGYAAGPGYDLVTGLGSPVANLLVPGLVNYGAAASSAPTITTNPLSQSVTAGAAVSFTAAATGSPAPTVQWEDSTNNGSSFSTIAGATSATLSIGTATLGENGYEYEAIFSNSVGTATTTAATLTVTAASVGPTITTNPQSQTVAAGAATATFTAAATGNPTPTVQWEDSTNNGASFSTLSGATSTSLVLANITAGENGYEFKAIFTNTVSTATTTAATLTVTTASTGSLSGTEATAAASYNLTTLGTSDWAHWGRGGNASNFDHDASGGSQISNVTKLGPGSYGGYTYSARKVTWTNGTPTASNTGDDGYLWANNAIGAGYSFTVPASTTSRTVYVYLGGAGAGGTLTAHLSDSSAANYTVSVSGSSNFQDLVAITYNAASAGQTLTLTYDKTTTIGSASGSVDLIAAWLTASAASPAAPTVTTNPQSQSVASGSNVSFSAAATGTPTPTVQWEDSTNSGSSFTTIAGATATTLTLGSVTTAESGYEYKAIFSNSAGTATTTPATLTVTAASVAPTVTTNPQSQSVTSGTAVSFSAAATGNPSPTIEWELSTNNGSSFATIAGATSTTLSIGTATASESGYEYKAIFSNSAGTATTTPATLTVTAASVAPTVTTNPQSQSVISGTAVSFSAAATGSPSPTVQWEMSTNSGGSFTTIAGATSTTLSIGTATLGETGYEYEAVFTNSMGTATTSPATLTVSAASAGSLTGSYSTAAASYNLTTLGTSDWAHWGRGGNASNFDHDKSGGSQISNVTKLGSGSYGGYTYSARKVIWTNGTPTASNSGDDGYIWANNAIGAGYSFTVPASTTSHTLYIYLGGASSGGTLTAHLSDSSAANYTATISGSSNYQDVVKLTFNAASASQTLTISWVKSQTIGSASGSVDLIAAWLQ
jgi:hypothetical protein